MYRVLTKTDQASYEKLTVHPLQSWVWGEFRKKTGVEVIRVGIFEKDKLTQVFQISFHKIPFTNFTVGYFPKGALPNPQMLNALEEIGKQHKAVFIKLEPNITKQSNLQLTTYNLQPSSKPIFTKYTFLIDLRRSEEELLKSFESKTRYNIRVAQKHGVTIQEENTEEAFNRYLELTAETTKRQGFYAHTQNYHKLMWETLSTKDKSTLDNQPIAHLFTARYQEKILATWILFLYKDVLYYPYGASTQEYKQVMANNLMLWETIRWGKKMAAKTFDLWGTPGPDPKSTDPYFGFHRFKMGYNPKLVEFVGTYDLVLKPFLYRLFLTLDKLRWALLKIKMHLSL